MEPDGGRIRVYFSLTEREHSLTAGISMERPTSGSVEIMPESRIEAMVTVDIIAALIE